MAYATHQLKTIQKYPDIATGSTRAGIGFTAPYCAGQLTMTKADLFSC